MSAPSPLKIGVRLATNDDVDFLGDATRAAQLAVVDARGGQLDNLLRGRQEPIEDAFAREISNRETQVWIGDVDNLPVGYLVVVRRRLPDATEIAVITDLWVHPSSRGVGVGAALMERATAAATTWGAVGLDARALPGDRVTKNFFESFGLVARAIEVHKRLS